MYKNLRKVLGTEELLGKKNSLFVELLDFLLNTVLHLLQHANVHVEQLARGEGFVRQNHIYSKSL